MREKSLLPVSELDPEWVSAFEEFDEYTESAIAKLVPGYEFRMKAVDHIMATHGYQGYWKDSLDKAVVDLALEQVEINSGNESASEQIPEVVKDELTELFSTLFVSPDVDDVTFLITQAEEGRSVASTLLAINPNIVFSAYMLGVEFKHCWYKNVIDRVRDSGELNDEIAVLIGDSKPEFDNSLAMEQKSLKLYEALYHGRHIMPAHIEELIGTTARVLTAFLPKAAE